MFVRADQANHPDFHLGFAATSVGLDYGGSDTTPLVDIKGFALGGVELRGEVAVDFNPDADDPHSWSLGASARFDDMGIPMGPEFGASDTDGDNAYAADQMSSGTGADGNAASGQTDAVNPTFSGPGAYATDGSVVVQLYDENDAETQTVWFLIQAAFGPLFVKGLGVGWVNDTYTGSFTIDGGASAVGLTIELINLELDTPFTTLTDLSSYHLGLDGLSVTFEEGPIELSGSLLANHDGEATDYEGTALVRAWRLNIEAIGAYSTVDDDPSLFSSAC